MRTLKKYPNRRLYDTSQSCYVTIDSVRNLVRGHERFRVIDSKSGADLTRLILLQIITEQENDSSEHVLNNEVLQHLIRFYRSGLQADIANFLEQSISFFLSQQEVMEERIQSVVTTNTASTRFGLMQQMTKENMKLWESMAQSILGEELEKKEE